MRDKDKELAARCRTYADAARKAEQWVGDNRENVGGECDTLRKNLRASARNLDRLARAAERKMCVGVFGPSQAGKSYLIGVLAKDREGNLITDFQGTKVDFIKNLNPVGGKESTGLVTRFTTTEPAGITPDKPVRLRLFSQMDLVRVFANTYYADCDHKEAPDQDRLVRTLKELEKQASKTPVGGVTSDDVEELRDYLNNGFASRARVQLLAKVYWNKAMELAPRLPLAQRARLFGLIWDNTPQFDGYFLTLSQALEDLGNPEEVNCPYEALSPRKVSIIDVALLDPNAPGAGEMLELATLDGKTKMLPRSQITALTAELTIYMPNEPDAFFAHTDLLDFPGYRSRLKTPDLQKALQDPAALEKTFFLRGKVAYLFERYCDEQELTSMLLCIGPSNQEVQDLPGAINSWIRKTQGETPEDRKKNKTTLFFVLTKSDMHFEKKSGEGNSDDGNPWDIRLTASLTSFFGAQYPWVDDWDGRPFNNVFLLRNPSVECAELYDYDENGRETMKDAGRSREAELRSLYISSELVQRHIADPMATWSAFVAPNDGGVSLLRQRLTPICDPDSKYEQTRLNAIALRNRMLTRLNGYYRDDDSKARRDQKALLGRKLVASLAGVMKFELFADLLSRFLVSDQDLFDMANECAAVPEPEAPEADPGTCSAAEAGADLMGQIFGDGNDGSGLFGGGPDLFGDGGADADAAKAEKTDDRASAPSASTDRVAAFCRQAVDHWTETVRERSESDQLRLLYRLSGEIFGEIASELILGARQTKLLPEMEKAISDLSVFANVPREVSAWRMASEAAYRINSFVSWLGHDPRLGQKTDVVFNNTPLTLFRPAELTFGPHGEPVVGEKPAPYDQDYCMDWMRAFFLMVVENAEEQGDNYDAHENRRLGDILDLLKADPQADA